MIFWVIGNTQGHGIKLNKFRNYELFTNQFCKHCLINRYLLIRPISLRIIFDETWCFIAHFCFFSQICLVEKFLFNNIFVWFSFICRCSFRSFPAFVDKFFFRNFHLWCCFSLSDIAFSSSFSFLYRRFISSIFDKFLLVLVQIFFFDLRFSASSVFPFRREIFLEPFSTFLSIFLFDFQQLLCFVILELFSLVKT